MCPLPAAALGETAADDGDSADGDAALAITGVASRELLVEDAPVVAGTAAGAWLVMATTAGV